MPSDANVYAPAVSAVSARAQPGRARSPPRQTQPGHRNRSPLRERGSLLRPLLAVVRLGLLGADQAVAVRVDLLEHLVGAQPLGARDVAVAVAVHLAEPQRPLRQRR